MFAQGAFQINPNLSPEEIERRRRHLEAIRPNYGRASTIGAGLGDLGLGIMAGLANRKFNKIERQGRGEADDLFSRVTAPRQSSGMTITGMRPPDPIQTQRIIPNPHGLPQEIVDAVNAPTMDPTIQAGIFRGESGGDYDALFGYSQRPDGAFAGVKPTDMTVAEVVNFTDPSGDYGQWVKGQVGRVATPVGAYQVVGSTLRDAIEELGISPDQKFDKATQDRIGSWVLAKQGTGAWAGYKGPAAPGSGVTPGNGARQPDPRADELRAALGNPWLNMEQRRVIQGMLGDIERESDPLRQMQLQKGALEIAKMQNGDAEADEYGLTPQFITDADGNLKMLQLSKSGQAKVVNIPEGSEIAKGVEKLDLGTVYQWYNTLTGTPIGAPIPKDIRGAEADKAIGTAEGKAAAEAEINLPKVISQAEDAKRVIDAVIADPALESITGNIQGNLPAGIPFVTGGQAGANANAKLNQIKGQVFLEAYESLRGAQAITDIEGKKAEQAKARLDRAQDAETYREALRELKEIIDRGLGRAYAKTGRTVPEVKPEAKATHRFNPATGEIEAVQ